MRVTYLKLENVAGLMVGSNKSSIEIYFDKGANKIITIQGRNGVGKTVLLSSIHPFSYVSSIDDRSNLSYIIKGKSGYKEIHYIDGDDEYIIKHFFKHSKDTHSVKSYFMKNGNELNPNGNVSSFVSLVEEIFGLTPDMMRLVRIGSNVNSFISLQPAKRKEYIGKLIDEINAYLIIYKKINEDLKVTRAFLQSNAKNLYECHVSDPVVEEENLKSLQERLKEREKERDSVKRKIIRIDTLIETNDVANLKQRLQELTIEIGNDDKILEEAKSLGDITLPELEKQRDQVLKHHHDLEIQIEKFKLRIDTMMKQIEQIDVLIKRSSMNQNFTMLMENIKTAQRNLASLPANIKDFAFKDISFLELSTLIGKLSGFNSTARSILMLSKRSINMYIKLRRGGINVDKWLKDQAKKSMAKINRSDMKFLLDQIFQNEAIISPPCESEYDICPYYRLNTVINDVFNQVENDATDEETLREIQTIHQNIIMMENELMLYSDMHLPEAIKDELTGKSAMDRLEQGLLFFDLGPLNNLATSCKNYELFKTWSNQLESYQNQADAYRNSDIAMQLQNKRELEASVATAKEKLQSIIEQSKAAKDSLDQISHNSHIISERDQASHSKKTAMIEMNSLNKKLEPLESAETERQELKFKLQSCELLISTLESDIKEVETRLQQYYTLINRRDKLEKVSSDLELISKAVSTKTGIPVIYMKLYLDRIKNISNDLLDIIYHGSFRLADFNVTPDSFEVPYIKNNAKLADIRYASQSEVSLATLALSFALSTRASNRYNIMLLDEIDGGLDDVNRMFFMKMLDAQMDIIHSEQVFVISQHLEEMSSVPMDIIQLSDDVQVTNDRTQNLIYP